MNDQLIIEHLQNGKETKAFRKLYGYQSVIQKHIIKKGGTKTDAEDIFQESLLILCRKANESDFTLSSSLNTYLFGIANNLWNNQTRKNTPTPTDAIDEQAEEETDNDDERKDKAKKALKALNQKCIEILQLFYYESKTMEEIASHFGFSSAKSARNQKYKCLEKAKQNLTLQH